MEYDAFISYAHGSHRVAAAVQEGLQRFAKPWWRRKAIQVFLDRTILSANPGLWSSIVDALEGSEWFILVASPEAAASIWVNREIAYWLEHRGTERLLIVLADGTCAWEEGRTHCGLTGSAVPTALQSVYQEDPRYLDLRWAETEPELSLRNPRFRDQLAELAAPIRGVSKDELEGTDLREYRRFRRTAIALAITLSLLTVVSMAASLAAINFSHRAAARTADADFARLVAESRNLSTSNPSLAILLAVEATRIHSNAQSQGAVLSTLAQDPRFVANIVPGPGHADVSSICIPGRSTDALVGGSNGSVWATSLHSGARALRPFQFRPATDGRALVSCSRDSRVAVVYDQAGYWSQLDPNSGKPEGRLYRDLGLYRVAVDPSGKSVALSDTEGPNLPGHLRLDPLDATDRSISVTLPHSVSSSGLGLAFSPDGGLLATVNAVGVSVWSTTNLTEIFSIREPPLVAISATPRTPLLQDTNDVGDGAFSSNGELLIASAGSNLLLINMNSQSVVWSEPTGWYEGSQVGFTDDGRLMVNRSAGEIQQLAVENGDPVGKALTSHVGVAVDFALMGSRIITASDSSAVLSLYDLDSNGPITRTLALPGAANLLEYDPRGRSLLISPGTSSITLFVTTREINDTTGKFGPVLPSLIQPRFIESQVVGGFQQSLTIGEFDGNTGKLVTPPYAVPFAHATNARFESRKHDLLLANVGGDLDLYREGGAVISSPWVRLGTYPVLSSSGFAKNGSIAVFDSGTRRVWVLDNKGQVTFQMSTDVTMAASSPDADELAILHDLHVDLFNVHTGAQIGGSIAVPPGATDLEWSADGSRILAFGPDAGQLIDVNSLQPLGDPLPSSGYLALRPDGNQVATIVNGTLVLWNVDVSHLGTAACQAAGRNLTQSEWSQYLSNEGPYRSVCPQWPLIPR